MVRIMKILFKNVNRFIFLLLKELFKFSSFFWKTLYIDPLIHAPPWVVSQINMIVIYQITVHTRARAYHADARGIHHAFRI